MRASGMPFIVHRSCVLLLASNVAVHRPASLTKQCSVWIGTVSGVEGRKKGVECWLVGFEILWLNTER